MINIFYACDDRYVPFLTVSLTSLIENASDTREYNITVLHSGLSNSSIESVKKLKKNNIKIDFCTAYQRVSGGQGGRVRLAPYAPLASMCGVWGGLRSANRTAVHYLHFLYRYDRIK